MLSAGPLAVAAPGSWALRLGHALTLAACTQHALPRWLRKRFAGHLIVAMSILQIAKRFHIGLSTAWNMHFVTTCLGSRRLLKMGSRPEAEAKLRGLAGVLAAMKLSCFSRIY